MCGCTSGGDRYTLPAPNGGLYLIHLCPGCASCVGGATVRITEAVTEQDQEDLSLEDLPELPMSVIDGMRETIIAVGMDPDEARKVLIDEVKAWATADPGQPFDEVAADIAMEDHLWPDHLCNPFEVLKLG